MAQTLHRTAEIPYAFAKRQWSEKKHSTCYVSQGLKDMHNDPLQEHNHKWSAFSLYAGGADTTVSGLMTFFLAMTLFPDVQKRAQEEIDRVTGKARLPVSADKERLPYIEAVMKETHRWHPVVPMSLPHTSNREDVIRGYRIPKGALILPNTWWFTHDPATYHKPMEFRPERFINTPTHVAEPDPRTWTFGFGRRVCPGRYVADNALFIMIAQSLAVFDVKKAEENGRTIEPVIAFEPGVLSHPVPYRASICPRSKEHEDLIRRAEEEYPWLESSAAALNMAV
jgi:cytochrome P450